MMAVPSPRQLIVSLSLRRAMFDLRPVNPRLVMDKVAMGQVFLTVPGFSAIGIIPPKFHTQLHIHVAIIRRTNKISFETLQKKKAKIFRKGASLDRTVLSQKP
jgi:hypothetical protein